LLYRALRKIKRTTLSWNESTAGQVLSPEKQQARALYQQRMQEWNDTLARLDIRGLDSFYWYHTIDLGEGLVTPGDFDYRPLLPAFHFPEDMRGLKVLDVGSATGFFAFEFEKRGANVVSVELPSLAQWDMSNTDKEHILAALTQVHHARDVDEATYRHLHGPFQFCSERLGSKVRRHYATVYELNAAGLGEAEFDLIFVGEVLLHLFSPLKALDVLAPLCRGTMVIATQLFESESPEPLLQFLGLSSLQDDNRTWWSFSVNGLTDMLKRVGFDEVSVVGTCNVMHFRNLGTFGRQIIHARKAA
jgi:tRNA (mo5U34)-methyltransferase